MDMMEAIEICDILRIILIVSGTVLGLLLINCFCCVCSLCCCLEMLGFRSEGVEANSFAAAIQTPYTSPDSAFAMAQSTGATGRSKNIGCVVAIIFAMLIVPVTIVIGVCVAGYHFIC
ncbi:hypothetical protein LOD99_7367 [Oopsacas minuta]|uniref:Uncharacterized protein n=1 Tax=Oopsacas minuta TaxID=111878 RepID=A0AAV7JTU3_9METZ|nr:hypothetical protein LOD99_7367 [Oopsacas minuta]